MFAYGVFFDRNGDELKIDFPVSEEQVRRIFNSEDDVLGTHITGFVTEDAIRSWFRQLPELVYQAQKGKPLVLDDEESLIALAATRTEAKKAFTKEYMRGFD